MLLYFGLMFILTGAESIRLSKSIYHYVPEVNLSYCTRKLNASHQVGCSSDVGGSAGMIWMAKDSNDVDRLLAACDSENTILAIDFNLFANASLVSSLRLCHALKGLLVFAPDRNSTLPAFSESSKCPNSLSSYYGSHRECDVVPAWNPPGYDYSSFDWPFPVVLIHDPDNSVKADLSNCFSQFNEQPVDETRCTVEINNFMSAVLSTTVCSRRQNMMSLQIFETPQIYCDELTGLNIVLSASNTSHHDITDVTTSSNLTERTPRNSLLVLTRMDSRSMFERSGFGSQGVLPSVSVLLSAAVHLLRQPAFKNSHLKRDLFFVFLDNEAYDFMGSSRLNYDLDEELLARYTGFPLGWKHIYGLIELGELSLPTNKTRPTYFMLTDRNIETQTQNTTTRLMNRLTNAAEKLGELIFQRAPEHQWDMPLPPTASLQTILQGASEPLAHILLSDHTGPPMKNKYFESFLDTNWPPPDSPLANELLMNLANSLSDALHREVTVDSSPIPEAISYPSPEDFMDCFVHNTNCSLLRLFLSYTDLQFLSSLGSPVPTQTYLPLQQHELKLSHLVSVLLMGLTGDLTETPSCPMNNAEQPYVYLMGYYNGTEHCFRTMLDLADRFVLFRNGVPVGPAWVRSRLSSTTRYLRWYRGASSSVEYAGLALGILLIILSTICALQLKHMMNIHAYRTNLTVTQEINQPERRNSITA